jgi:hypothetical protein
MSSPGERSERRVARKVNLAEKKLYKKRGEIILFRTKQALAAGAKGKVVA